MGCAHVPVTEYCPDIDRMTPDPHYKSVCSGSGVACRCAEDDLFEPSECCTVEGKMDRSEKCNGEDSFVLQFHILSYLILISTSKQE